MDPKFSEFQFTYGLTREIENQMPMAGVPFLPTQHVENDFPIDVGIPRAGGEFAPLFLQYKRANALTQANAREWDDFDEEYYRFKVYSPEKSDQHNKLVDLSEFFETVYYVSPAFYKQSEYRSLARNGQIHEESVIIDCSSCPKITDDESHSIAYTDSPARARFYSEPQQVDAVQGFRNLIEVIDEETGSYMEVGELHDTFESLHSELDIERVETTPQEDLGEWVRAEQAIFFREFGSNLTFAYQYD